MAIYTAGRRRTMLILLLTSVILITIDLRGNTLLDGARSGFDYAFRPFEVAAEVVAQPIERAWSGVTEVDDLQDENERLRRELDGQRGDRISYQNALQENRDLRALNNLESLASYEKVTCSWIGASPSNQAQVVEIDCGTVDGLRTGMPVVNEAGLVGKVHQTFRETSVVMLITDPLYHLEVKVVSESTPTAASTPSTSPSGLPLDSLPDIANDLSSTTTTTTSTTLPFGTDDTEPPSSDPTSTGSSTGDSAEGTGTSVPVGDLPDDITGVGTTLPSSTTSSTTTTTLPPVTRETGMIDGLGPERLPRVRLIADTPQFGGIDVGDQVLTSGGRASLAPPDVPVGVVANEISVAGVEGTQLEVDLSADLTRLNFLTVILYQPTTELGGG